MGTSQLEVNRELMCAPQINLNTVTQPEILDLFLIPKRRQQKLVGAHRVFGPYLNLAVNVYIKKIKAANCSYCT